MADLIYLDYNATTPMDARVLDAMRPFFLERFGNAASRHHQLGCDAAKAVEQARSEVAQVIGADPREIVFTSGATEAINLAIKGILARTAGANVVTVRTEHKAVLDVCEWAQSNGHRVTHVPVDEEGRIDLGRLKESIDRDTALVCAMHANNETGVLHPIGDIGRICRDKEVLFLTDATQSFGKESIDVNEDCVDLLTLSAHKMYGPKGIGALFVRRKGPRVRLDPLIHGGGHERGMRSGTLNVPAIVGLGAAAKLCLETREQEHARIRNLRDRLRNGLMDRLDCVVENGAPDSRLANTLNVSFMGLDGEHIMREMPNVAVSSSSACTSAALQPSYVLGAMGLSEERIDGSVRFSLGRMTTDDEIENVIARVESAVLTLTRVAR